MSRTLAFFDVASNCGWAEGEFGGRPLFGQHRFAPAGSESPALMWGAFKFFSQRFMAFRPHAVVFEAPLVRNVNTARVTFGLCSVLEAAAYGAGVPVIREVHVSTIRAQFLPKGSPRGGRELKVAVIDECRRRGFEPRNDDEADAIAGWHVACKIVGG